MKPLRNFTPHAISVYSSDGNETLVARFESEGTARISEKVHECPTQIGYPVVRKEYSRYAKGLPEPNPGTIFIVSLILLQALKNSRFDVVCPDTGPESAVRDSGGRIIGVRRFQAN